MNAATRATEAVVRNHLDAFIQQKGVDAILADYDDGACFHSASRMYEGRAGIREFFVEFLAALPPRTYERFKVGAFRADGEIAFVTWSVGTDVPLGTDTFVVRDGKIVSQTFAMHATFEPRRAGA